MFIIVFAIIFLSPLVATYIIERNGTQAIGRGEFIGRAIVAIVTPFVLGLFLPDMLGTQVYTWVEPAIKIIAITFLYLAMVQRIRSTNLRPVWLIFFGMFFALTLVTFLILIFLPEASVLALLIYLALLTVYAIYPANKNKDPVTT